VAYDHLGTFNRSQFERFLAFARAQLPQAPARIQHLKAEVQRVGSVVFRYDQGIPKGYAADPPESYLGRLLGAYQVLGGDPFLDLRVRLKNDPVYLLRGTESTTPQLMSNGEIVGAKGLSDAPTAELMREARAWVDDTLISRFESLERKIRHQMDYSDELKAEIVRLTTVQMAVETTGSLEYIAAQINQYLADQNYRAVYDDGGSDKFGFFVYAPFSSYDVASGVSNGRVTEMGQRQNSGFVNSGGT
jgi:hypothetical protein